MSNLSPYQPILFRVLHGGAAVLTVAALISGFWVYNTYDKRWGSLPLPNLGDIQGIHGTIALTFLIFLPLFALYSFRIGYRRLLQGQALSQLKQVGQPVWWMALQRLVNTLMLLSVTTSVMTGRMMKEEWLPAGELNQAWYQAHLLAWGGVFVSLALHLLMGAKVGGVPLLRSMFRFNRRDGDSLRAGLQGLKAKRASLVLRVIEAVVIGGIIVAFILPIF
jgi:hypothetical protein